MATNWIHTDSPAESRTKRLLRENGLSVVVFGLFFLFLAGESLAGFLAHNDERRAHGEAPVSYRQFVTSGTFLESTTENWESEFLEMGAYALLTAFLFQRGSAESKKLDRSEPVDRDPRTAPRHANVPWPVRRGGWILKLYENSLSLGFALLFVMAFLLHAWGGMHAYNEDQLAHGEETVSLAQFVTTSQFWFQSLQNWQSEFLGLGSMVVLSIFLRQRGSPESKPVDSPHSETGGA
jgi:succinate dehydrogenase hydrophobic anchor subunit